MLVPGASAEGGLLGVQKTHLRQESEFSDENAETFDLSRHFNETSVSLLVGLTHKKGMTSIAWFFFNNKSNLNL